MKCQKLSCWLFTAVALKVVYIVEVVFVCFFGGRDKLEFGSVSHTFFCF